MIRRWLWDIEQIITIINNARALQQSVLANSIKDADKVRKCLLMRLQGEPENEIARQIGFRGKPAYNKWLTDNFISITSPKPQNPYADWLAACEYFSFDPATVDIDDQVQAEAGGARSQGHDGISTNDARHRKFQIMDDDSSVYYKSEKYALPPDHFMAVRFMAELHKKGNSWIKKQAVFGYCQIDAAIAKSMSVRKWFLTNGGEAERFARADLIKSDGKGCCQISVSPDDIEIIEITNPDEKSDLKQQ